MPPAVHTSSSPLSPTHAGRRIYDWLFWSLLFLFELFVFTLPLFPNGDGPVHIYLSTILWRLAAHSSPLYAHYYAIRHLVQPYSFHYYLLISLEHIMSADMAEKVFAGLIWATVALGFRKLAQTLGATGSASALLVFPLLFCWPMSGGFFNFTFGTGLLLFALAFYTRLAGPDTQGKSLGALLLTLVLLVLAHPVPIMVLICLILLDLGFQLLAGWQRFRTLRLPVWQLAALALSCIAFVFPILIADKATVASALNQVYPHFHLLSSMLLGFYVSYFHVDSLLGWVYQALIVAILPAAVLLFLRAGLVGRLRNGSLQAADRLMLSNVIFLLASLSFPENMNGSALFAVRMWFIVWLLGAVCAAALDETVAPGKILATFGTVMAAVSLVFGLLYVRPVARQQADLQQAPIPSNARGLFFQPENAVRGAATHTWWSLAFWDGVRAFTAHNDVLLNTPWLQLTIVPVKENGRAGLMRDVMPNLYSEAPSYHLAEMEADPQQLAAALQLADFLLFADPNSTVPDPIGFSTRFLGPLATPWQCTRRDFYAVCLRK